MNPDIDVQTLEHAMRLYVARYDDSGQFRTPTFAQWLDHHRSVLAASSIDSVEQSPYDLLVDQLDGLPAAYLQNDLFSIVPKRVGDQALRVDRVARRLQQDSIADEVRDAYETIEESRSERATSEQLVPGRIRIPGRTRVQKSSTGRFVDWENYLEQERGVPRLTSQFTPENIMRNTVRQDIIERFLPVYDRDPEAALSSLQEEAALQPAGLQGIYAQVVYIFKGMKTIDDSPDVAHEMSVRRKRT